MKVLITGSRGQLGQDIVLACKNRNIDVIALDHNQLDITDYNSVDLAIKENKPNIVIDCAAYTAVDKAESNLNECFNINVIGTRNVAEVCKKHNATLVYFSTDYVFDGQGTNYYKEYDHIRPFSIYGLTKWQGEEEVRNNLTNYFILRISWVYGLNGNNFVNTMLNLARLKKEINVVSDQIGSPTYTVDLAELVVEMIKTDKYGLYNVTNEGVCSWYEFACEIFKQSNITVKVKPVLSSQYPSDAIRPHNSRLDKSKLEENGFKRLPTWQDALKRYLTEFLRAYSPFYLLK